LQTLWTSWQWHPSHQFYFASQDLYSLAALIAVPICGVRLLYVSFPGTAVLHCPQGPRLGLYWAPLVGEHPSPVPVSAMNACAQQPQPTFKYEWTLLDPWTPVTDIRAHVPQGRRGCKCRMGSTGGIWDWSSFGNVPGAAFLCWVCCGAQE
jgi:hypothetical protein